MKVSVKFSEVGAEEAEHLRLRLADTKATAAGDDALLACESMEEVFALQIVREVEAYVERDRRRLVEAQAGLGSVFVQLPAADREALTQQLIERARASGVDVSPLDALLAP